VGRKLTVNKIKYDKKEKRTGFLDPREGFQRKEVVFEVRKDFLTDHTARIVPFRGRKLPESEISKELLEASKKGCPFCPDQLLSSTPRLIPEISPEGRLRRGKACLFPNAYPYAQNNCVIVLLEDHDLPLPQFTTEMLRDGFLLARDGIEKVIRSRPEFQYGSINWNYLPSSGGGIFHPHLQVVIEDGPTFSHQKVLEGLKRYQAEGESFFWEDYLSEERGRGERYIGNRGNVYFLAAYSPRGIFGEIIILFPNRSTIPDISEEDWANFCEGLIKIFGYLTGKRIFSFNLSLFSGNSEGIKSWVYGRLCPRMIIPPWNTSDINYFEKLHNEVICVVPPEELCKELKPSFL
jgi:UDPglucose--hexose-1-phosphate uridylyltransferase